MLTRSPNRSSDKRSAYKIRSSSLPVRLHPIVANLDDDVASLRTWSSSSTQSPTATWLSEGTTLISLVLTSLSDLLNHPQSIDPLRNSLYMDSFSDDLLRLADRQASFRLSLIDLLHLQAETRAGLRRRDPTRLASAIRAQLQACQKISRLALFAGISLRTMVTNSMAICDVAICDAGFALADACSVVMNGVVRLSGEATEKVAPVVAAENPVKLRRIWWLADLVRWEGRARKRALKRSKSGKMEGIMEREEMERMLAMERLDKLETCIKELEISSGNIFRALVNARVSLLNILTPTI